MKKLLLICLIFSGCVNNTKKEKPFIIIDKFVGSGNCSLINDCNCRYTYQDKNGNTNWFCDCADKYNIGDTIK